MISLRDLLKIKVIIVLIFTDGKVEEILINLIYLSIQNLVSFIYLKKLQYHILLKKLIKLISQIFKIKIIYRFLKLFLIKSI
jgi:hypothetical protein